MKNNKASRKAWVKTLYPQSVVWEVTLACNMRCLHCGSSASPLRKRPDELSTKEALNLIVDFKELGVERVCFSGGEPFLRTDWEKLAVCLARLGMRPGFISNGFLIDRNLAQKLSKLRKYGLVVSLSVDGDEKTHDLIRQTKGSFQKSMQALDLLCAEGVATSVITSVHKINLPVLPNISKEIFKYNIGAWQLQLAVPWGRMAENKEALLSPADYLELVDFFLQQRKLHKNRVCVPDNIGYFTKAEKECRPDLPWKGCQAGMMIMGITSNGGVTGCLSLQEERFIEGNVRERSLKDIWFDPELFSYNRKFKITDLKGFCRRCEHGADCRGGCKSTAYGFSGCLFESYYCLYRIEQKQGVPADSFSFRKTLGAGKYHP
ncbi:MAG: radical SAM protein [Candidatus Omnitrophica bacterium]|nr:radical SAM protein [Candidatus Omnitrophota bacterium]